ncbi:GNAT family N-acetyltransferase [Parachitinimonas caeni]|uniref:GNAT family protein n=1 Tax=Parachitinimonas caeni TaxID=3031301 RepID=A0ABT7E259_9NEIS|nr:GNAT family protein [Parachitinimonas caeni]MDK2126397.1 GNAT family protein [Parachitinimonas caeni]
MLIETPKLEDAKKLLEYFHELVASDTNRVERVEDVRKISIEMEESWIRNILAKQAEGSYAARCIYDDSGKVIGLGEIERRPRWIERHVAEIRFGLLPDHFSAGVAFVRVLENLAKEMGIEVLYYFHLTTQKQGLDIMQECKYKEVGIIEDYYKIDNSYVDRIYLQKNIVSPG